jgi:hypothetical protein
MLQTQFSTPRDFEFDHMIIIAGMERMRRA